jgi:hypothetical protein
MGNSFIVVVQGKGTMNLEFTYEKVLALTDVYFAPKNRKNPASGGLLNKF